MIKLRLLRFAAAAIACLTFTGALASAAIPASIVKNGMQWTLDNEVLRAVVSFAGGSIDLTSLYNKAAGVEYLTGPGPRQLFRHICDGAEMTARDGRWILGANAISDIELYNRHWGKRLAIDVSRPSSKITLTLLFEIYDGRSGLRYNTDIKNEDSARERLISASDVITLNFPDNPHTIYYVPWQTKWGWTRGGLDGAKRNCLTAYNTRNGWALLPENNWATSLKPGLFAGNPKHPFLLINAWSHSNSVTVSTDPLAVQLVLFPNEKIEYFAVNLQVFQGDQWDARVAVAEHFRKRYKYYNPVPRIDYSTYLSESMITDANFRNLHVPILSETGFDGLGVTEGWNIEQDVPQPTPRFTTNLPALADYITAHGLKIGYYFAINTRGLDLNKPVTFRDLADPATVELKIRQFEDTMIGLHAASYQSLDQFQLWKNETETTFSHPSDNVYRKVFGMRRYMNAIADKYPDCLMQVTCEMDNPQVGSGEQGVGLLHVADNGLAGTFNRTDNPGFVNLGDAFNYIGLLPVEAFMGVWGENSSFGDSDPWPKMFSPKYYNACLLGRYHRFYRDLRRWTPEQKAHMRVFNDWRKSPRIASLLGEIVRPIANGPENNDRGPYAWAYVNEDRSKALLVTFSEVGPFTVNMRWLDGKKTYLVEDLSMKEVGYTGDFFSYEFLGKRTGEQLAKPGLPSGAYGLYWIQELVPNRLQVLYADQNIGSYEQTRGAGAYAVRGTGKAGKTAILVVYDDTNGAASKAAVSISADGRFTWEGGPHAQSSPISRPGALSRGR